MVLNVSFETLSLFQLLKSLLTILRDWKTKNPLQKWCYLYSNGKVALRIIGIPLYEEDQRLYWYSRFPFVYIGAHLSLGLYTIYFYIGRGEFIQSLPCTCMLVGPLMSVSNCTRSFFHGFRMTSA